MGFFSSLTGADAASAAKRAAGVQTDYLETAQEELSDASADARKYLKPYSETGLQANTLLADALGINGPEAQAAYFANFQNDPGYQATLEAGLNAIGQGQTFAGNYRSGSTLRSLMEHGQRQQFGQFQDRLNRLGTQQGQGINVAGRMGDFRMRGAEGVGNILSQIGTTQASGIVGAANARAQGTQNILGLIGGGLQLAGGLGYLPTGPFGGNDLLKGWGATVEYA